MGTYDDILNALSIRIREIIKRYVDVNTWEGLEEIRIREGRPLMVIRSGCDMMLAQRGLATLDVKRAYAVSHEDICETVELISESSIYAFEDELKNGYITLRGGHRVGLTGRVIMENGNIKTLRDVTCLNIRVTRELKGVSEKVIGYIYRPPHGVYNTMILSPPMAGKTTLLRDIVRNISNGGPGRPGLKVGVVDERSEIAGCYNGVPQNDVGIRTDVLDCCPKDLGMLLLIRSMSPEVICTDEIGRKPDVEAIQEACNAGVGIITTVHATDINELNRKPYVNMLVTEGLFDRYIVLGNSMGKGTVEAIYDGELNFLTEMPMRGDSS
ncbi:MAG: stage III sporulation protein AA [Thermoanaerobacteraceae bacterium]|nr:stage III sporulation protein AA [Thermoanaerobacteraceae bacterium]